MDLGLRGKVAVVTGASRGIGKAIASALLHEGCAVAICGRNAERLNATVEDLSKNGARVIGVPTDVTDEAAVGKFVGTATEQFYNGLGVAHGGYAATVLDSALGCAINSMQPAGRIFTTLELKINYTRPLTREAGEIRCEATVLHSGSRTATAEARMVDAQGRLYAHATTTCIVV